MTRPLFWGAGLLPAGVAAWFWAMARPPAFSEMVLADRARLGELLWTVTGNPETYRPEMSLALRQVLERYAPPTAAQRDGLLASGREMARLHRLYWTDARVAAATGRPTQSAERRRLEQRLIASGFLVSLRLQANADLMKRIAAHETIMTNHGVEMVMDEPTIVRVMASQDVRETETVLARLLAPPR